jgi:hypothetical protein
MEAHPCQDSFGTHHFARFKDCLMKIDVLFDAVESKSHIMFKPEEEIARQQYLVGFYKSKIREVHHELEIMNEMLKELNEVLKDREMELINKGN